MAVKKDKKRKVVVENFKSISMLLNTMNDRPLPNDAFKDKESLSSQRDERDDKNPWSGTATYNDAMELMKTGFKDPLEKMKKGILKMGAMDQDKRPKMKNDFVGFVPHVPHTLMNLPITMINKDKQIHKNKTIHLIYSYSASSRVTPDDMIKGGINFISLVNSLEKQNYRVKIDIISNHTSNKTLASLLINVKEYGQKLNLLKLTFPLVHPAMFRRIGFKWVETVPELKDPEISWGYGTPLSHLMGYDNLKEANYLKDHGVLKGDNTYYCTVYTAMKTDNVETLAREMGITK
jgi:hypothetical protein